MAKPKNPRTPCKPAAKRPRTGTPTPGPVDQDQIAARAYQIWQDKGCPPGLDEQNWREAEAQLLAQPRR